MFQEVLFPPQSNSGLDNLLLQRLIRFAAEPDADLETAPIVVFDLETTGLDVENDEIIEIGAEKLVGFEVVEEFSFLVKPSVLMSEQITSLTGITPEMLENQPTIDDVLPKFFDFIRGGLLIAHNADFDFRLLRASARRLGYDFDWPCACTFKMSRELLPTLENRKLDTLAKHYGLSFGSRHRSMGDVRVTSEVLRNLITKDSDCIETWKDLAPYYSI